MRGRARAWGGNVVMGGKIINTALLIPAGALYTTGAPVLQGGTKFTVKMGPGGGPNLMGALKFHDIVTAYLDCGFDLDLAWCPREEIFMNPVMYRDARFTFHHISTAG